MAAKRRPMPYFVRAGRVGTNSAPTNANDGDFHFDLLSFVSIAEKLGVDLVQTTWQQALEALGEGATSIVQQAQVDAEFNLAFKRSVARPDLGGYYADTSQEEAARYKALIYELIALAMLSDHPNVIDLLGYTWEIDADSEQPWPVLLTERSTYGTMADLLLSSSHAVVNLDCREKQRLCADVAQACLALHQLGIIHGDIKLENVLIFRDGDGWAGKLIDFGYSCLGTSDHDKVQVARTRPWQAPEHREDQFFEIAAARRMDVFSFGMLLCRTFLSDELPETVGRVGHCHDANEHRQLLEKIDLLKSSEQFLRQVLTAVGRTCKMIGPGNNKEVIQRIFELTLPHNPHSRAADFTSIVPLLSETTRDSPLLDLSGIREQLPHSVLDIGALLADLDDTDYIIHRSLVADLELRTKSRSCPCFESATRQLWLCNEIGFGVVRNPSQASYWLGRCQQANTFDPSEALRQIDKDYDPRQPERLLERLGYATQLPFDPVELYRIQGRLEEAKTVFRDEVDGRKDSIGDESKSYLTLLSTLALIEVKTGNLAEAENASRLAVEASTKVNGEDSHNTISAENYLAYVLFQRARFAELEDLQQKLIPRKERNEDIGETAATTLNSQNYLVAAYYFQEKYAECLQLAHRLTETRRKQLGREHPETLNTLNWVCRARLETGDDDVSGGGLEDEARELLAASETANGKHDDSTVERKEILSTILLSTVTTTTDADGGGMMNNNRLSEARELACEVLDACEEEGDGAAADPGRTTILYARAQTTLICILALEMRLDDASTEIENTVSVIDGLRKAFGADYVEVKRFHRVKENVPLLRGLLLESCQGDEGRVQAQANLVRERIARRWKAC